MKMFVLCALLLNLLCLESRAQYLPKSIEPYRITISADKTSNLIFPAAVKSVDRGSENVLVQKASGVENILQLKAGEANFRETNVTVVTNDGHFYSFAVNYNPSPGTLNYSFVSDSNEKAIVENQSITSTSYNTTSKQILQQKPSISKTASAENLWLTLNNLFIKDNILWLHLSISNNGIIPFEPAFLRMFIQDKKGAKNRAIQQNEITPLIPMSLQTVNARSSQSYIFSCTPFTIPNNKLLIIQIGESKGTRQLTLQLNHHTMKKIKSLPQMTNN